MKPERTARLVARWVRLYTRGLPAPIAQRRIGEIDADLHDQIADERARGTGERRIALSIAGRMVRGLAADASWRGGHAQAMARAMVAMALAQALVGAVALIAGKHKAAISSVFEILGLTGMFIFLFLGSAWLFRQAARRQV